MNAPNNEFLSLPWRRRRWSGLPLMSTFGLLALLLLSLRTALSSCAASWLLRLLLLLLLLLNWLVLTLYRRRLPLSAALLLLLHSFTLLQRARFICLSCCTRAGTRSRRDRLMYSRWTSARSAPFLRCSHRRSRCRRAKPCPLIRTLTL